MYVHTQVSTESCGGVATLWELCTALNWGLTYHQPYQALHTVVPQLIVGN